MSAVWRRIGRDLKNRQHIDAYGISIVAFVLAILSLIPDVVPDPVRWAVLLAGVGILVWRITIPERLSGTVDDLLHDRFAFDRNPLSERLKKASEVCIFAPSAINILSGHNCDLLRTGVLNKADSILRVVILDPANESAVQLATQQLDDSLDYPVQDFRTAVRATANQLAAMASWHIQGSFSYRFLDYNPGFSLVSIDPTSHNGQIIVEFHGFHNEATSYRMHIELSRKQSDYWYTYWTNQFSRIWAASSPAGKDISSQSD